MSLLSDLHALADAAAMPLPESLLKLLQRNLARYPAMYPADYAQRFKTYSLSQPVALSCLYDFEWLGEGQAVQTVADWLRPDAQQGARFVPFAQSGAGDVYALVRTSQGSGCGLIWHDSDTSELCCPSFEDFVCHALLSTLEDLSHLLDEGLDAEQAAAWVRLDAEQALDCLPASHSAALRPLLARTPQPRPYKPAPRAAQRPVLSFISQAECAALQAAYTQAPALALTITAPWDMP